MILNWPKKTHFMGKVRNATRHSSYLIVTVTPISTFTIILEEKKNQDATCEVLTTTSQLIES